MTRETPPPDERKQSVARNPKAAHDYHILETWESGIVLTGTEVKSLRNGKASIKEAYARVHRGEVFLEGMNITPYAQGNRYNHDPVRSRKLLLHRREIDRLIGKIREKGFTLVPLSLYEKNLGLALVNNPWGESNDKGLHAAAQEQGVKIAAVEKFEERDVDMVPQMTRLKAAGADAVVLVGNAAPGAQVIKSLQRINWSVPVISHWGISGGRFPELAGAWSQKVAFVQTYSFFGPLNATGQKVLAALKTKYPDIKGPGDVVPPVGVANAYDAMRLVALAIGKANSTDGDQVRQALENIERYDGLIKSYAKPFTPDNHDALNENDYIWVRYNGDDIVPVATQ